MYTVAVSWLVTAAPSVGRARCHRRRRRLGRIIKDTQLCKIFSLPTILQCCLVVEDALANVVAAAFEVAKALKAPA